MFSKIMRNFDLPDAIIQNKVSSAYFCCSWFTKAKQNIGTVKSFTDLFQILLYELVKILNSWGVFTSKRFCGHLILIKITMKSGQSL